MSSSWAARLRPGAGARTLILLSTLLILGTVYVYHVSEPYSRVQEVSIEHNQLHLVIPDDLRYKQPRILLTQSGRKVVVTVTPWLAPIVWEETFDPVLLDSIYRPLNITIALTVFAVGKYIRFLPDFLSTAEQFFFVGFRVHYYVFTDQPDAMPPVKMAAGREVFVRSHPSSKRWQEITANRMKQIQTLIETQLRNHGDRHHADYIFCLDVDGKFHAHWGTETLGTLVSVIHFSYYATDRSGFSYERRQTSLACMSEDQGDFYYCGGAFGGEPAAVNHLATTCGDNFDLDAERGVEAEWQEESHLNRYLWLHKPSKLLSPEYLWLDIVPRRPEIKTIRFSGVTKNYAEIRPKTWTWT